MLPTDYSNPDDENPFRRRSSAFKDGGARLREHLDLFEGLVNMVAQLAEVATTPKEEEAIKVCLRTFELRGLSDTIQRHRKVCYGALSPEFIAAFECFTSWLSDISRGCCVAVDTVVVYNLLSVKLFLYKCLFAGPFVCGWGSGNGNAFSRSVGFTFWDTGLSPTQGRPLGCPCGESVSKEQFVGCGATRGRSALQLQGDDFSTVSAVPNSSAPG